MLRLDIATLLEKEMDRKDFLKHIGIAILVLSGLSAVLKSLLTQPTHTTHASQGVGYGTSAYGGDIK